ncbi:MAG TPA: GNAT family N-acetyltransferase [Candidatus Cloacimonadota bacterium]|nr:GNAT family N-acetyltransferase [Candidatus Cloacimonadota bacterium]
MKIKTNEIIIRDFERKDAENLFRIVREKNIIRFMPDWAENFHSPQDYYNFIDWMQTQKDSTDVYQNKRYVIALPHSDEMIGMVGMGMEETLNEVEVAYFMSGKYQRRGYTKAAIDALVDWCFQVSDLKYLIVTIDCANVPSCRLATKCNFQLFEKRTPLGHKQPNMESDSYFYYRRYRI